MKESLKYYTEALQIFEKLGFLEGESAIYTNIGVICYDMGEISKAYDYYIRALNIYIQLDNLNGQAINHLNIGEIFVEWNEFNKAMNHYNTSLDISHKIGANQIVSMVQ